MYNTDNIFINISKDKLKIDEISKFSFDENYGAIVSFFGFVRNVNNCKTVSKIDYVVFENLAYSILIDKCYIFSKSYNPCKIYICQYNGRLYVGEINLLIAISTVKRDFSFFLCSELLEFIKNKVPIWKKEHYVDGSSSWINSKFF